jgi:hypothetical protein
VRWLEVTLRLALIAGLFFAITYGAATWIIAPLGLVAIFVTAELAVRPYASNTADRLLLCCGGTVTALILLGLGLNLTPWGLTRSTWNLAWLIVSVGVFAWRRGARTRIRRPTARMGSINAWMVLATLIIAGAVLLSLAGVQHSEQQPTLAFSVVSESRSAVVVEIEATSFTGTYQIVATPSSRKGHKYSSNLLSIVAGSREKVRQRVPINANGVWSIALKSASNGAVIRRLKVDLK